MEKINNRAHASVRAAVERYLFTFHTAFGVAAAEPYGATRWRFER